MFNETNWQKNIFCLILIYDFFQILILERIVHFACGHVIPDENILPLVLTKGPSGRTLDFSYQFRDKKDTLDELGRALVIYYLLKYVQW